VLQANGTWKNVKDADGGLTSLLGFRLIIDEADPVGLFVVDAATGARSSGFMKRRRSPSSPFS